MENSNTNNAARTPSQQSLRALGWLNIVLADVRGGGGPFLAIYLSASFHWSPVSIGIALSAMSIGSFIALINVAAAVLAGGIGAYLTRRGIFYLTTVMAVASIIAVLFIRSNEIDHQLARGCDDGKSQKPVRLRELLRGRHVWCFALAVTLFHFANAAMLPQIGQKLAQGKAGASLYMAACIVVAQLVMVPTAMMTGKLAGQVGRKPIFLVGFTVLPVRGLLYTLTENPYVLVSIQILDGIAAGIFGVLSILMIADFTKGTGRFNLTQGIVTTAQGIGASCSNIMTGFIVGIAGYNAGFLTLAVIAVAAFAVFYFLVPESMRGEPSATRVAALGAAVGAGR